MKSSINILIGEQMKRVTREYNGKQVERFQYIVTDPDTGGENYWETSIGMSVCQYRIAHI